MKHIGILGHSAEGSALCYLEVCSEGMRRIGPHMHPKVSLSTTAMGESMNAWHIGDHDSIRKILAGTVDQLRAATCDFFICPDNTAHLALETNGQALSLPGLHIADVVAAEARRRRFRNVAVLGTIWTMESSLYASALDRVGIGCLTPIEEDRCFVNRTIFDELCVGTFTETTRARYGKIIDNLKGAGCDAVILGCTEIPLLISPEVSSLPTLDSTRLLAKAAVGVVLGAEPCPTWRGGPS